MARHGVPALSAVATFVFIAASLPLVASSHVRIVRLSSVEGPVQMDRATGEGLERAILNTPIVEGTRLVTGADGLAEVEFENESALRLTGDSDVKFSQLLMNDAGAKINQIHVVKGLVYLDTAKGDDIYRLVIGNNSFLVHRDSQLRLSVTPDQVKLAVLKGDVQLENQPEPVIIQKKESLTLDVNNADTRTVAKSVDPNRFDAWNKEREDYSKHLRRQRRLWRPEKRLWPAGFELLRRLFLRAGLRLRVAAVWLRQLYARLESVQQWRVDVLSRLRILVGFSLSLGMAAISLRLVGVHQRRRMGVAAGRRLRRSVVSPPTSRPFPRSRKLPRAGRRRLLLL